jgi:predicted nucleotidyltransferase component of viral defense system
VQTETLRETLVFKGGTALKKCWFGNYRFSEDLDFSGIANVPVGAALEQAMHAACQTATALLDEYASIPITCQRYTEKDPHPGGQEAFTIRARFPWQRDATTRVMVEVSMDEPVLRPTPRRPILHGYGEPITAEVRVYALEEIIAEKLRAILQHAEKLHERGWSRSRARDYYDLWRMFGAYRDQMDLTSFAALLHEKCALRHVAFRGTADFFQESMIQYVRKTWQQWLGPLVPGLPPCDTVLSELHPHIEALIH